MGINISPTETLDIIREHLWQYMQYNIDRSFNHLTISKGGGHRDEKFEEVVVGAIFWSTHET